MNYVVQISDVECSAFFPEKWSWQVDIEKVKEDLKKDINGAYEAIELLIERKRLLEEKLVELNHPELIKK